MPLPKARKPTERKSKLARQARKSANTSTARSARNTPAPSTELSPVPRVRRLDPPASTPSQRRAAQNLLDALGGPQPVVETLRLANTSKSARLADLMQDHHHDNTSFHLKLQQVGMRLTEFTELLLDVNNAQAIARLVTGGSEVAESILSRATDQFRPHGACQASGRMLLEDPESGQIQATDYECFGCQGTGYILESADRQWVELYLELVRLRKNGPVVDASRRVTHNNLNMFGGGGDLAAGDGAPSIDAIIKRADQQQLALPAAGQTVPAMAGMPEDDADADTDVDVVEVELVSR